MTGEVAPESGQLASADRMPCASTAAVQIHGDVSTALVDRPSESGLAEGRNIFNLFLSWVFFF